VYIFTELVRVWCSKHCGDAYKILDRDPEEKGLLGRPRRRWENNTIIDLRETVWWRGGAVY
jgi:hypothetical protein